jgi:hypothetical protein
MTIAPLLRGPSDAQWDLKTDHRLRGRRCFYQHPSRAAFDRSRQLELTPSLVL